VNCPVHV
jgi:hypothetical protein